MQVSESKKVAVAVAVQSKVEGPRSRAPSVSFCGGGDGCLAVPRRSINALLPIRDAPGNARLG